MKRIVRPALIVVLALVVILFALPLFINANDFRPLLESKLSAAIGRTVKLGDLKLSIFSGGVTAGDLSVADDPAFSAEPFVRAKSFKVGVDLMPLIFSHQLNVRSLEIDEPQITLLRDKSGKWNVSSLGAKSDPPAKSSAAPEKTSLDLSVKLLTISGGRLTLGDTGRSATPEVLDKVNLELHDFSSTSASPFSLTAKMAGGDIKLQGKAGPIASGAGTTPVDATFSVAHFDVAASGLASSGAAGLISAEGQAVSKGRVLHLEARIKGEKWKVSKNGRPAGRPVEFDCTLDHDTASHSGRLSRGAIHIGKATAALTGTYNEQGEATVVNLRLGGENMPLPEIAAVLPALNIALPAGSSIEGGVATVRFNLQGPTDHPASNGSFNVANARLAGFNLGAKLATVERLAGIPASPNTDIDTLSANLATRGGMTSIQDIRLVVRSIGELTGAGTISAADALDFKMRLRAHTSGTVMAALGQKGDTQIPFLIRGTASNPSFVPDVGGIATDQARRLIGGQVDKGASGLLKGLLGGRKPK